MRTVSAYTCALALLTYGAFSQSTEFEVASVKPNRSGGGTRRSIEPGKITWLNLSLGEFIEKAYDVKHYQLSGPDWVLNYLSTDRYDVVAKAASPVPTQELLRMLGPLLTKRFHLAVHRETRVLPVYALVVDKGGPKFKEGDGGMPASYPDGTGAMDYHNVTMESLASGLSVFLGAVDGRPVLTRTGLEGSYTFKANLYALPAGLSPGEQKQQTQQLMSTMSREDNPVFTALREQLGLRLESQKAPIEMLIIDQAEKIPIEN